MDKKQVTAMVFLDLTVLAKAFDSIGHTILLKKCKVLESHRLPYDGLLAICLNASSKFELEKAFQPPKL